MDREIKTRRLQLRPLIKEDAPDVFEWVGDPVVNRYMPYALYQNVGQVEKWIASIEEDENEFAFCLKDTHKVIGSGSVTWNPKENAYELGYNLNRAFWGKGYATEAAKAMLQWAYRERRVIEKCGFQFDHYGQYSRFDGSETFEASFYTMHLE